MILFIEQKLKLNQEVLSTDRPFVALIAVVDSSLSPVGRFLKDYLQNDLQLNNYKKNFIDRIILMTESF